MRFQLLFFALLSLPLSAQGGFSPWRLEGAAGINTVFDHRPVFEQNKTDGGSGVGWRIGARAAYSGNGRRSSLLLGFDVLNDRVTLDDYREETFASDFFFSPTPGEGPRRVREGRLAVNTRHLRGVIGHRIAINRVRIEYGLILSGFVGGRQRFDFIQTTTSWSDPTTGLSVTFPEPLVSSGSTSVRKIDLRKNTYGGLLLGAGFLATDRLSILLDSEFAFRSPNTENIDNRHKYLNWRLGLTAAYRFL